MGLFQGFVVQESTLPVVFQARNSARTPVNLDALPSYRVYGPSGSMLNGTGTAGYKDSGTITAASNASPIVVTSASHGLTTGTRVTVAGVGGNTNANGTFTITVVDANTFSLNGSTGNGAYTSGGTWNVTGLYTLSLACTGANGYAAGNTYSVLVSGAISATAWGDLHSFTVT